MTEATDVAAAEAAGTSTDGQAIKPGVASSGVAKQGENQDVNAQVAMNGAASNKAAKPRGRKRAADTDAAAAEPSKKPAQATQSRRGKYRRSK